MNLFDYVLVNRAPLESPSLADYASRGARPVARHAGRSSVGSVAVVERELAWSYDRGKIRHDPDQLAAAILDLVRRGRPRLRTSGLSTRG
jgi:hypothetical protein